MRSIHSQLERAKWYRYDKSGRETKYVALAKAGGHRTYFDRYWTSKKAGFDGLMALLSRMTTDQAGIIATLYSAWNDFILDGRAIADDAIVDDVMNNWHDAKKEVPEQSWRAALPWMRTHGLIPTGYGHHTKAGSGKKG
jgi:type I restriction enzyme S subunit